jgi:hypothetical protein
MGYVKEEPHLFCIYSQLVPRELGEEQKYAPRSESSKNPPNPSATGGDLGKKILTRPGGKLAIRFFSPEPRNYGAGICGNFTGRAGLSYGTRRGPCRYMCVGFHRVTNR